jgi:hypothetical protein
MTGTMWVVLAVGVLIGMYLGRWWRRSDGRGSIWIAFGHPARPTVTVELVVTAAGDQRAELGSTGRKVRGSGNPRLT